MRFLCTSPNLNFLNFPLDCPSLQPTEFVFILLETFLIKLLFISKGSTFVFFCTHPISVTSVAISSAWCSTPLLLMIMLPHYFFSNNIYFTTVRLVPTFSSLSKCSIKVYKNHQLIFISFFPISLTNPFFPICSMTVSDRIPGSPLPDSAVNLHLWMSRILNID